VNKRKEEEAKYRKWEGRNLTHFVLGLEALDGQWYKKARYCYKFTISTSFGRFSCGYCSICVIPLADSLT